MILTSEYVLNAGEIFLNLEDNLNNFESEAVLIDELKCHLVNYGHLDDFNELDAYVIESGDGYDIYFEDIAIHIKVEDKMIVDLSYL